ncbi:Fur family transcriptional regulator [Scatolibacter rhodanostii]|uniref:Fur family transcriptional regulator n=1 Tax=Scatolibacter rhodanostii TaxID=2014781 RepID=UPI001FA8F025|nr:transcriptional repressor [Scatolibacter rhodanostii]
MAILKLIQSTESHPTADWIYAKLKPKYPDLSLGTVYRNLKKFCECGKIKSIGVINGQEHFDANIYKHAHFICEECGIVEDIDSSFFSKEDLSDVSDKYGIDIRTADIVFNGSCKKCLAKGTHSDKTA